MYGTGPLDIVQGPVFVMSVPFSVKIRILLKCNC